MQGPRASAKPARRGHRAADLRRRDDTRRLSLVFGAIVFIVCLLALAAPLLLTPAPTSRAGTASVDVADAPSPPDEATAVAPEPLASPSMIPRAIATQFDGARAFEHARALVSLGPRSVGSAGHDKAVDYIVRALKGFGLAPERMTFGARTPDGDFMMTNIIVTIGGPFIPRSKPSSSPAASRFPGRGNPGLPPPDSDTVVLAAHYDTKRFPFPFVGANDGGSGTAALLELARVLAARPPRRPVVLVFFDGEEAFREWSATDSLYGSRHLAAAWRDAGLLPRIRAFILMDMIGFRELRFMRDLNSNPWVQNRLWQQAAAQGRGAIFTDETMGIEDDHVPFVREGVPAAVLIDFEYGPNGTNAYWHTAQDTLDKISPRSLEIVGKVVEATTREL